MPNTIRQLFARVPRTYERINHILTFGLDILWRRRAAREAVRGGGDRWIDLCSGTGEMAVYLSRYARNGTRVYAVDFSSPMLRQAKSKSAGEAIRFCMSEIKTLPFPEKTFDLITLSFATRNINTGREDLMRGFREFHRVLKPGGRFINLETSQPSNSFIRQIFHLYVRTFVKPVGSRLSGAGASYAYLSRTIPRFFSPDRLEKILLEAGFEQVESRRLFFGAAAIHRAVKNTNDLKTEKMTETKHGVKRR
jgi:demethylmenaquinone methyltransferase/2-methoxy-6-polyprenyl-1,4-benzoquinol methylase